MSLYLCYFFTMGIISLYYSGCIASEKPTNCEEEIQEMVLNQYPEPVNISPTGKYLLYKVRGLDSFDLILHEQSSGEEILLDRREWSQLSIKWSPIEDKIAYQSYEPSEKSYVLSIIDLESRKLLRVPDSNTSSAVPPVLWSPNGDKIAYLGIDGRESFKIVDLKSVSTSSYSLKNIQKESYYQWKSNSKIVYSTESGLHLLDVNSGRNNEILRVEDFQIKQFSLSPDKRYCALVARKGTQPTYSIYIADLRKSTIHEIYGQQKQVEKVSWRKETQTLLIQYSARGQQHLVELDLQSAQVIDDFMNDFLDLQESQYPLFARKYYPNNYPSIMDLRGNEYRSNSLESSSFEIKETNFIHDSLPSYLYIPTCSTDESKAVIHLHGGPKLCSRPYYQMDANYITSLGHYFLTVNYRGSSGYTIDFENAGSLSAQGQDLIQAIKYLTKTLNISVNDIYIYAESYAVHIVNYLLTLIDLSDFGGVFLFYPTLSNKQIDDLNNLDVPDIFIFYGKVDPYARADLFRLESKVNGLNNKIKLIGFEMEGHYFHRSSTWIDIFSKLTEIIGRVRCW